MKNKYKTLLFIKNMRDPSAYYRLGQYLGTLEKNKTIKYICYASDNAYKKYYNTHLGKNYLYKIFFVICGTIKVTYYMIWDMLINHSKIVVINRKIFPRIIPFYGKALLNIYLKNKTVYWDFDDNIIYDKEITQAEKQLLSKYSNMIIVTNEYLKNTIDKEYMDKVKLLVTTDSTFQYFNLDDINSKRLLSYQENVYIVWVGTKNNLAFLYDILPFLDKAAEEVNRINNKTLHLKIVSNDSIIYKANYLIIENIKWTRNKAKEGLLLSHIGVMPLEDSEYTRGKGGFKGIQYISAALPCVMSNVGFNTEVIQDGVSGFLANEPNDWVSKIIKLSIDDNTWSNMSITARNRWEEKFSSEINKKFWNGLLS